jgi:hypothetical protein
MAERNAETPDEQRIVFRVGINLGDVIVEQGAIHGDSVSVAARLEAIFRGRQDLRIGRCHDRAAGGRGSSGGKGEGDSSGEPRRPSTSPPKDRSTRKRS